MISTWRAIDTTTRQLEQCRAQPGETVTVIATDADDPELRQLVALCLERLQCRVHELIVRSGTVPGDDPVDNEAAAAALLHSDFVVDVNGALVEPSRVCTELLDEARVLVVGLQSVAELETIVSHPGLARRIDRASGLVAEATTLSIDGATGTSVELAIGDAEVVASTGVAADIGDLAHWPGGSIWIRPGEGTATGSVVMMPGDLLPDAHHILRSPVRLELENGSVVEVLGDSGDGDVIRSSLEALGAETAYRLDAIGWGMNNTRGGAGLGLFDPARLAVGRGPLAAGVVNLRLGHASSSWTVSLTRANLRVDDATLVVDGDLGAALAPDIYERAASE